jgi:hypothetical protein
MHRRDESVSREEEDEDFFSRNAFSVSETARVFQIKLCLCTFKSLPGDDYTVFPSTEFTHEVLIHNVGAYKVFGYKQCTYIQCM